MKRSGYFSISTLIVLLVSLFALTACKSGGMAVTRHGQFMKINIEGANELPDGATEDLMVKISNRGVKDLKDIYVDVEMPNELLIESQTADRGIQVLHDSGSPMYHFTMANIQPTETSTIRFAVRTRFGSMNQTGDIKVTAWQKDLVGEKLIETRNIKVRK